MRSMRWLLPFGCLTAALAVGCGDDSDDGANGGGGAAASCSPDTEVGCPTGQVCEEVESGEPACFDPVLIEGRVFDLQTDAAVSGARVVARNASYVAISPVATSGADGRYRLAVPTRRDRAGQPVSEPFTLRADAAAYQSFPTPPRVALPLSSADAEPVGETTGYLLANATTDVGLIALPSSAGLGSISGSVITDRPGSALVVAGGVTGVADADGTFVLFNVPAGSQRVSAYLQGANFTSVQADVAPSALTANVTLQESGAATATVSGSLSIVNGGDGDDTSVLLALEETFIESVARGEAPPGLRAAPVSGAFSIAGVPDGRYVVLAAFENDRLVRDPDTSIGGTQIQHIEVAGSSVALDASFKVTGALAVVSPGADGLEQTSATPTFVWEDDSSEDAYLVVVYDAFGTEVWQTTGNFDPGGNKDATVDYAGPSLEPGMIYQFRATSIKDGTPISSTEDLLGVFTVE